MALTPEIIRTLPKATGVYILRDASEKIIYIGKAKDLQARLRSYLGRDTRLQAGRIVETTEKVDYILTRNEAEALLLENQMIKAHRPRYNIDLKDDKTYVRIHVTTGHEWPAIGITRKVARDGARYYGPYSSAMATRRMLSAIGRIFPLRRCKDTEFMNRSRPCVYHSIGLCLAPCVHRHIRDEYDQAVRDALAFLEGRNKDLEKVLEGRMQLESERLNFEKAAKIRDQIQAIRTTLVPQAVIGQGRGDTHVFAAFRTRGHIQVAVLQITKGTLTVVRGFTLREGADDDIVADIMLQFYLSGNDIPDRIYTDTLPKDRGLLEKVLSGMRGSKVAIAKPLLGKALLWMAMALDNARSHARGTGGSALEDIAKAFHLTSLPVRMECYDISTLQGDSSAASRVVFMDGEPDKTLYRHYRIRTVQGQDDFAMLKEVFSRRLARDESRPDLIVIDGGKGQLGMFLKVLEELNIPKIPVVAMAKARHERHDRFFLPGRKDAVRLHERSAGLRTLQRIRDEAHRFAVKYHRTLRSRTLQSPFAGIPGIGPKKAAALLALTARIADPSRITEADLAGITGLTRRDIDGVMRFLKGGSHP